MGKVVFKKLVIENMLSFGKFEFDFSKHSGLNYIFGTNKDAVSLNEESKNGVGKSGIFDCLLYALFGQTIRNIGNKYIANRQRNKTDPCSCSLSFTVDTGNYEIITGLKNPNCSDATYLILLKDGEDISKSSIKETRRYIETELLKTSYLIFKNNITLSSSGTQNFFTLVKSQKREFIEEIFNLVIFGDMLKMIRSDINSLDKEIQLNEKHENQLKKDLFNFEESNKEFTENQNRKLNDIKSKLKEFKKKHSDVNKHVKTLTKEVEKINLLDIESLSEEKNKFNDAKFKTENLLKLCNNAIKTNTEYIAKHKNILDETCDACNEKLIEKLNISSIQELIDEDNSKITKYNKTLSLIIDKLEKLNVSLTEAKINEDTYKKLNNEIKYKSLELDGLNNEMNNLNDSHDSAHENPWNKLIEDYSNKITEIDSVIKAFMKKRKLLDISQTIVGEDGAKKFIIKDLVEIINTNIRKYLNEMGVNFTCIFNESFNYEFLTETGPAAFENFSQGEKSRISIATIFAFRDILSGMKVNDYNIISIDEFLDNSGLDSLAINSVIKILKRIIISEGKSVYLISHRECIEDDFDNVIELQKKHGFTTIIRDEQAGINLNE